MDYLPFFVWPDVAVVYVICAIPLIGCVIALISRRISWTAAVVALVVMLLVPWTYTQARCRHDAEALGELLGQLRFGEARVLAHKLIALDPSREFNGQPLRQTVEQLDAAVRQLAWNVAAPLQPSASEEDRLNRGRQLAMLGEVDAAIEVLKPLRGGATGADAANLMGTLEQNRSNWPAALELFSKAKTAWQSQPPSEEQAAGVAEAVAGIAHCQRKSGAYVAAEATYQELLGLSPTAETHFLLAQFYEDAQHAEKAAGHVRRAMAMAPDVYGEQGKKLLDKLAVYHFGCFRVGRWNSEQ